MWIRPYLQGLIIGGGAAIVGLNELSKELWRSNDHLRHSIQAYGLAPPPPKAPVQPLALKLASEPDWSAETKVDAIRAWNERVRRWHRQLANKIF